MKERKPAQKIPSVKLRKSKENCKNGKKKGLKSELSKNKDRRKKATEKIDFINWLSLPAVLRPKGIKTQKQFSEKYKVSEHSLAKWKRDEGFWEEVTEARNGYWRSYASDALYYLFNKRIKNKGREQAVKIFLQAIGEFTEKSKSIVEEDPITPEKAKEIADAVKRWD